MGIDSTEQRARTPSKSKKEELAAKREAGGYAPLPFIVTRSREFAELSPIAVKMLIDLLAQYNGKNNGDLNATWKKMSGRGWKSKDTLYKALRELEEAQFILTTRPGGRNHKPTLYAVTFLAVDACGGKLTIKAPSDHRGAWKRYETPMPDVTPTSYPINPEVREMLRRKDPEELKQLARKEYQSPPPWPEIRTSAALAVA